MLPHRIYLLSPAHSGGKRAALLARPEANFPLAERFRSEWGAPIGEVFAFLSGLYFRGKLAYATRFSAPPPGIPGSFVITTNRGLMTPAEHITLNDLASFGSVSIDLREPRYREPLAADLELLARSTGVDCSLVLLGSIATAKYVELLVSHFGERVCFPAPFIGMGDMQRGALLLRSVETGVELPCVCATGAVRSHAAARVRASE